MEIYAGIHDGHEGSVPVSHSITFFNKMVNAFGRENETVSESDQHRLLCKDWDASSDHGVIDGRNIVFARSIPGVRLTLFDGGHEMLSEHCLNRLFHFARSQVDGGCQ